MAAPPKTLSLLILFLISADVLGAASEKLIYTNKNYLYSVDYPQEWRVKEVSNATMFYSPFESKEDKFAEFVEVDVEDLSEAGDVSLIDYHRRSVGNATKVLKDFKLLEEAKTEFLGHEAVAVLYTALVRDRLFRFKKMVFLVGKDAYSVTYTGLNEDFDKYLPAAEKLMRSLQVSP